MSALRSKRVRKPVVFGPEFEAPPCRSVARSAAPALEAATVVAEVRRVAKSVLGQSQSTHKRAWSPAEDALLVQGVAAHGAKRWSLVAEGVGDRNPKQCRERWCNHISPDVHKGPWTPEEDFILHRGVFELGHKWAAIAQLLINRTDNQVKNRYNSFLSSNHAAAAALSADASSTQLSSELPTARLVAGDPYENEDANLLLELQRRNALEDVPRKRRRRVTAAGEEMNHAKRGGNSPWTFEEDLRLATGVQVEVQRLGLDAECINLADLSEGSWRRIAESVRDRGVGACHYRWRTLKRTCVFSDAMRHVAAPPVPEKPKPPVMEEFSFDEVLAPWSNNARSEDALLCFEEYDEGAYTPPVAPIVYAADTPSFFERVCGTPAIAYRFSSSPPRPPTHPRRTSNTPTPQKDPSARRTRSKKTGCKGDTRSMKAYYLEAKRRSEFEAWEKSVFA